MNYLVFDIGGTNTKIAFYRKTRIIEESIVKTIKDKKILIFLENKIKEILTKYKIKKLDGLVIAAPSPLSPKKFMLLSPPNLPKIKNLKLKKLKRYTKKLVLENDANCSALGAYQLYKDKNLVCLTLGTGLGCGIIINGELYKGKGIASEFGHTSVDINGKKCNCGNIGCLEEYVSARTLLRIAKKNKLNVDCFELQALASKKNKKALKTYSQFAKNLSFALVNIANTLDPEMIVLTGGLSNASKFFLDEAIKQAEKKYFRGIKPKVKATPKNLALSGGLSLVK